MHPLHGARHMCPCIRHTQQRAFCYSFSEKHFRISPNRMQNISIYLRTNRRAKALFAKRNAHTRKNTSHVVKNTSHIFQMFEKQYGTKAPKQGIRPPEIRRRAMNICIGACIKTSHRPHLSGTGGAVCRILASACAISCRDNSPRW